MDVPRGVSIALPFPTSQFHHATFRRLPRDHRHTPPQSDRTAASMAIPGARMEDIPPALPPPRHIYGLDDGIDLAWQYQNEEISREARKLAPIKSGSSLFGNSTQIPQLMKDDAEDTEMDVDLDLDDDNAQSIHPSAQSPSLSHSTRGISIPALNRRPSAGMNQSLPGEIPLAQQNHNRSNHAYDQHLLLKIGKSNSPPGHAKTAPFDHLRLGQKLSIQTRTPNLLGRPAQDTAAVPADPNTKWLPSPTSAVSLSPRHSWREHSMAPRSPAESMSNSFSLDSEAADAAQARKVFQARVPTSHHFIEDTRTRSERGSYDSTMHTDVDSPADEAGLCSNVIAERPRPLAHHGTKRRAVSPPLGTSHGPKQEPPQLQRLHSSIPPQQSSYRASSLSSTASSINYPSYASSTMLSHASSMTSIATPDIPLSRESRHLFASPQSAEPPGTAALPLRKAPDPAGPPHAPLPGTSAVVQTQARPARIGNHIICACCLKKPKKFETEEQLRAHENEKQYSCAYCNNRFKNKNEAERHQNSLHVRKQSWSCAAVSTYQAAFHPSSLSNPRNLATDTCGFCGEEFPNQPPNWEERVDHLTNVHKFGECNTTKKFYRADHFRQHLKHSHAGKSGKWTNILENSCQRDEASSEITSQSPTASELSTSGSTSRLQGGILGNPTDASLSGVETIDGVQGES